MVVADNSLVLTHANQTITLRIVNDSFVIPPTLALPDTSSVHILASGPSIQDNDLKAVQNQAVIFVNGSITLTQRFHFSKPVAYVITDPRFIRHNREIPLQLYQGDYPLYISDLVAQQLLQDAPDFLVKYQQSIYIIFPVNRPVLYQELMPKNNSFFAKLWVKLQKRPKLKHFKDSPFHQLLNKKIGVSLDIRHGFVEGGTVAFVATQLAFSLGFRKIHLYGVDLLNSQTPRFYENSQNTAPSKLDQAVSNRIVPSFDLAGKVYQQQGGQIINHSPISKGLFTFVEYQQD